jgi:serine/threonine protein kinase
VSVGQLLSGLASDPPARRCYVDAVARVGQLQVIGVAAALAVGPKPDPCDPRADPPWRLRDEPRGERLDHWVGSHGPLSSTAAASLGAAIADTLHRLHERGVALGDLAPWNVVLTDSGPVLTDVGFVKVTTLYGRSILLRQLSIYEAPEVGAPEHDRLEGRARPDHVFEPGEHYDGRADLFSLGVILRLAVVGSVSFYENWPGSASSQLVKLVGECRAKRVDDRPRSAAEVAQALRAIAAGR